MTAVLTSFTQPGARVVFLPWPTTAGHAPGGEPDPGLADAVEAAGTGQRTARVVRPRPDADLGGPASPPFWADLVGLPARPPASAVAPGSPTADAGAHGEYETASPGMDLIITSVGAGHAGTAASDHVARAAARLLRVGGILAVLTHSDCSGGELIDPTGAIVAAGQNADLLYVQHIVTLLAPVHDGHIVSILDTAATEAQARTRHRAAVRGLPSPHRGVHSDLLVFTQPRDHQPPPVTPAAAAHQTGVIR